MSPLRTARQAYKQPICKVNKKEEDAFIRKEKNNNNDNKNYDNNGIKKKDFQKIYMRIKSTKKINIYLKLKEEKKNKNDNGMFKFKGFKEFRKEKG